LTHADQRQEDEDESFNENGSESQAVRDGPTAVKADDLICKVSVQAHSRPVFCQLLAMIGVIKTLRQRHGKIGEETKQEGAEGCNSRGCGDQIALDTWEAVLGSS
jgi:hypothetical protein